jgi:hypothetical protein
MPRQNQWDTRSYPWQRRGEFLRSGWGPSIQSGTRAKGPTLWLTFEMVTSRRRSGSADFEMTQLKIVRVGCPRRDWPVSEH